MNDTQQKLYELLVKFDKRCQDNGVVYFLGSGSALGAIRHQGFLPWDDDVDLYISRDNYNKIIANKDKFFDDDFVLVNTDEYPKYRNALVRMVDTNSTLITRARVVDGAPKGQFLELFILDPVPKDKSKHREWFLKRWVYTELLSTIYQVTNSRICDCVDEELYYHYKNRAEKEGYDNVLNELSNELFNIPESEADQYSLRWGFRNILYDIEWMQTQRYVPFEDIQLPVANCAESVLRVEYGDSWMYIPTADDQITHSTSKIMDVPYKTITEEYEQKIDINEMYDLLNQNKNALMNDYFVRRKVSDELFPFKQAQVDCSIELKSKEYPNIKEKYLSGDFEAVTDFFKTYYDVQFDPQILKWSRFIKISDEYLSIALAPILVEGNLSRVKKILALREKQGELSSDLKVIKSFVYALTSIYTHIDYREFDKAKAELDKINDIGFIFCDIQFNVRLLRLKFELDSCDDDKISCVRDELLKLLSQYDNPEIKYLVAESYFKQNDLENAKKWYLDSKTNLRHGFVLRHLNERLNTIKEGN